MTERALRRLHATLERGGAPIERFFAWAYGRRSDAISGLDFKQLVLTIAGRPDGMPVAMEILSMRLHSDEAAKRPSLPEVIELGKALVTGYKLHRPDGRTREDYELGRIIRACLRDEDGSRIARRLCRDLVEGNARHELYAHHYGDALSSLFRIHPTAMLDELFSGDPKSQRDGIRLMRNLTQFRMNPMGGVADDVIIGWCDRDPATRYPIAAAVTLLFERPSEKAPHEWTNLALQLLAKAPDPEPVFKELVARLRPSGWSGSLATKLETRLHLLAQLDISTIPTLQPAFAAAKATLKAQIEEERQREMEEDGLSFHFRAHDLRRTASTGMAEAGVPRDHIAKVLNHVEGGPAATRIYDRYAYDKEKRDALERWARRLQAIVEGKTRKVVPIAR